MRNVTITNSHCEYPLATSFEIIAPALDKYVYVLFTMYCKPESDFPVLIYKRNIDNPVEVNEYNTDYKCDSKEEFIASIKEVLSSKDTTRIIQTLYSKSNL